MATPTDTDLTPAISQQATEPISSSADGQSNTGRSIGELIRAQQYLDRKTNLGTRHRGLMTTTAIRQGCMPFRGPRGLGGFDFGFGFVG